MRSGSEWQNRRLLVGLRRSHRSRSRLRGYGQLLLVRMMTDSSCVPAGFSYLTAFGLGIFALVLSSWLVQLQRAVYRDGPALQRSLANATPLWVPGVTGALLIFLWAGWLVEWAKTCVPAKDWTVLGVLFLALALSVAFTAVARMIRGRVRLGSRELAVGQAAGDSVSGEDAAIVGKRPPNLPPARRRVIVEFALTYEAAVIIALIGVGLL